MIPLVLWAGLSLAQDISRFPLEAPVTLPETGAARFRLPIEARSSQENNGQWNFVLLDANGKAVPTAMQVGGSTRDLMTVVRLPGERADQDVLRFPDGSVDSIEVWLEGPGVANVTVERAQGGTFEVWKRQPVWRMEGGAARTTVTLPGSTYDDLRVTVDFAEGRSTRVTNYTAFRESYPVADDELVAAVGEGSPDEAGNWWVPLTIPQMAPVQRIRLTSPQEVIDRSVIVGEASGYATEDVSQISWGQLYKNTLRDIPVESMALDARPAGREFYVGMPATKDLPIPIASATVSWPGVEMFVKDAGPGPHRLLIGGDSYSAMTWDLQAAVGDLNRMAPPKGVVGAVGANPGYVPVEVSSGLLEGANQKLRLSRQKFVRELTGPPGLVRFTVPVDMRAEGPELAASLRVVDDQDRGLPHILTKRRAPKSLGKLKFERTEVGPVSFLVAKLPTAGMPVRSVGISTTATVFGRQVAVGRPGGNGFLPLRAFQWDGSEGTKRNVRYVDLNLTLGDELVVKIDNGDDPPLPIEDIEVWVSEWEVITGLPASGKARVVYGDTRAWAPDYDLSRLRDRLMQRDAPEAQLSASAPYQEPPLPWFDLAWLTVGVGFAGLGLVGVGLRTALSAPLVDEDELKAAEAAGAAAGAQAKAAEAKAADSPAASSEASQAPAKANDEPPSAPEAPKG